MRKTTVYLPDELKAALARLAEREQRSEADLIREAIRAAVDARTPPTPRLGLFDSGEPDLASRIDEVLAGERERPAFGER